MSERKIGKLAVRIACMSEKKLDLMLGLSDLIWKDDRKVGHVSPILERPELVIGDVLDSLQYHFVVPVDCSISASEALERTGRELSVDGALLAAAELSDQSKVHIVLFMLGKCVNGRGIARQYADRSLRPADPRELAALLALVPKIGNERDTVVTAWSGPARQWGWMFACDWGPDDDGLPWIEVGYPEDNKWLSGLWYAGVPI